MKSIMKKIVVFLMTLSIIMTLPITALASDGITPSGVAFDEIGSKIEQWAAEHPNDYASFSTAVFCKDEIIYQGAFGYADRENNVLADADTVYEWGSSTKTLVWVSVMQLWEKGQIDLNADIREYLPENFLHNVKYDDPITMLNLMNHDAGWCENVWAYQTDDESKVKSLEDILYETQPAQIYRPGEVCSYSNYGAALAGYIVERISGQPFSEYVHENIFEPLGMEKTAICPAHDDNPFVYEKRKELVCYANSGMGWVNAGSQLAYIMPYPAGAATGTIEDMAKYAGSLVSDDCPLFENEETRDFMFTPSSVLGDTDIGVSYHGFWSVNYGDVMVLGHDGGTNGCSSYMNFDVESGVGTVVLMTGAGLPTFDIPQLVFGNAVAEQSLDIAESGDGGIDISGTYIGTRSMRHGPLKFISLTGLLPVASTGDGEYDVAGVAQVKNISGDFYWVTQNGQGFPAQGYCLDDGTKIFSLGSQSYAIDSFVWIEIALLAFYVICAIVTVIMLLVKLICLVAKKQKKYMGSLFITISQIAKIISVVIIIYWVSVYSSQYGLTKAQGIIGCLIQMLCFASYLTTVGVSCKAFLSKAENAKHNVRYAMNIVTNVICIIAMIVLEFMRFWNV